MDTKFGVELLVVMFGSDTKFVGHSGSIMGDKIEIMNLIWNRVVAPTLIITHIDKAFNYIIFHNKTWDIYSINI